MLVRRKVEFLGYLLVESGGIIRVIGGHVQLIKDVPARALDETSGGGDCTFGVGLAAGKSLRPKFCDFIA